MAANFFDQFDPATAKPDSGGKGGNFFDQFDPGTAKPESSGGVASDLAKSLKVGAQRLPGMVTGLADLPVALATGARPFTKAADALGEATGFQPGKWADETKFSAGYEQGKKAVDEAWKDGSAGDIALSYLKNPGYTANQVMESVPGMVAGGLAGRALMGVGRIAAPAARAGGVGPALPGLAERALGQWAAPVAAGVGEGAVTAGQQMAQYQGDDQQTNALASLGAGVGTGLIGVGAGRVANRLGLETAETAIAKAGTGVAKAADDVPLSAKRRILGGMVSEALLQELPQSAQEQMWQNWADGKPLMDGVARAATEGAIAGGVMGAGANVSDGGAGKRRALAERQASLLAEAEALQAQQAQDEQNAAAIQTAQDAAMARAGTLEAEEGATPVADDGGAGLQEQQAVAQRLRDQAQQDSRAQAGPDDEIYQSTGADAMTEPSVSAEPVQQVAEPVEQDTRTPSQRMGLDPAAGPLSKVAAQAVDSGVHDQMQQAVAQAQSTPNAQPNGGVLQAAAVKAEQAPAAANTVASIPQATTGEPNGAQADQAQQAAAQPTQAGAAPHDGSQRSALENSAGAAGQVGLGVAGAVAPDSVASRPDGWRKSMLKAGPAAKAMGIDPKGKRLAQVVAEIDAADARRAGVRQDGADLAAGQIDREWSAFAPETGTLGVPRAEMPQIKAEHRGALVNFLKARGIDSRAGEVPANDLKPTQAEFSPGKVEKARAFQGGDRSILVSSDGYVVDGHHQWLAKRANGEPVKVIRLQAPIRQVLAQTAEFPSTASARGAQTTQGTPDAATPRNLRLADERAPGAAAPTSDRPGQQDAGAAPAVGAGQRAGGDTAQPAPAVRAAVPDAGGTSQQGSGVAQQDRPPKWRGNMIAAAQVARGLGIDAKKYRKTADLVRAIDEADGKVEKPKPEPQTAKGDEPMSVGTAPGSSEPVTVRDGVVYLGKYEALNYDTGEPVTVPKGSTREDVHKALRDAGALTKNDKAFGLRGREAALMFSRTPETKAAYETRIDALFSGEKAKTGTRILDSSDVMGLLGYPKVPLMLNESHLRHGLTNHPEMTAVAWKNVPQWIENPAAVYTDPRNPGRLTLIAPETLAGYPVVMVIEPNPGSQQRGKTGTVPAESLLVTAYAKTTGGLPAAGVLALGGHLKYMHTQNAPEIWQSAGGQFPRQSALSQGRHKILTEKQLGGYRRANSAAYSQEMSPELARALLAIRRPATKESVRAAVRELVNGMGVLPNRLGRVVVATAAEIQQDWEPLIGPIQLHSEGQGQQDGAGKAQGFYDPNSRTVFLIADHIRQGDELGVVAHELMHKHGPAVLGEEGWSRLHGAIESWASAPEGSQERQVYDEAAARVRQSRPEDAAERDYSSQELFPYAVQVALEQGVRPNLLAKPGTVARWLGQVKAALREVWSKIVGKPESFNSQDLVNLAFGIAQRENPEHAGELDGATVPATIAESQHGKSANPNVRDDGGEDASVPAGQDSEKQFSRSAMKSVEANIARGQEAMNRAILEKADQHRAMFRNGLGWVDFVWGDDKRGIAHIISRRMQSDGMQRFGAEHMLVQRVVDTIARGTEIRRTEFGKATRLVLEMDGNEAVLIRQQGSNGWLLTAFEKVPDASAGGATRSSATQPTAIRSRSGLGAGAPIVAGAGREGNQGILYSRSAAAQISSDYTPAQASAARPVAGWGVPEASQFDDVIYRMQDKHIDTKRVLEAIQKAAGKVADSINVYLQEELFHGRVAKRVSDFQTGDVADMLAAIKQSGLELGDVEEFLHARHAKEANALIAQREPGMPDGGSGMTDAAADAYFAKLSATDRAKLEKVAALVDGITAGTRQLYADYGLESQETVNGWGQMFKHYVPLQREDKGGGMGVGQGFSVKGKETKGRTGSTRKVVDILANVVLQRERALVRGEKNRVAVALVGMVEAHPNKDLWTVGAPPVERAYDPKTDSVVERADPMYKSRPNAVVAKVVQADGSVKEVAVTFNQDNPRALRMAGALKNLDAAQLEGLLGASAKVTRYFAAVNTQWNPVFGMVNLVRDVQGAMINLQSTPLAGMQGQIARDTGLALAGIYGDLRKARKGQKSTSSWARLNEQFQSDGGQTGYRDQFANSTERAEALKRQLNPAAWADSKLGRVMTAGGVLGLPMEQARKALAPVFNWLTDYNDAMENGVRLAAYKAALDKGLSREQAASIAKNLTVNFNRKGQSAQQAGALYAFFNAAMQGTARIGETLFTMDGGNLKTLRLSKTGKQMVYGGMLLGTLQAFALAAAGFDDEDPPDFVRERSLIIPTGDKSYVTIPMPLGLHVIPGIGRHLTEFALGGFKDPAKRAVSVMGMFADAFNPIGNAGMSMQTLAPTVFDPLVALTENKDYTGKPIARVSSNKALPGHAQGRDTSTWLGKMIAEAINYASGGNHYRAGVFSPTPDQIDYLAGQVGGGVWREASKVEQTLTSTIQGEELPSYKVPLFGRFYGNAKSQASQSTVFYAGIDRANALETELKGMRKDGKWQEAMQMQQSRPDAILIGRANEAERRVQEMRRQKRALIEHGAARELVQAKEDQITDVMRRFNETAAGVRAN